MGCSNGCGCGGGILSAFLQALLGNNGCSSCSGGSCPDPQAGDGLFTDDCGNLNVGSPVDGSILVYDDYIQVGVITDAQHGQRGGGDLHALATSTTAGFMSAEDKRKVDGSTSSMLEADCAALDVVGNFVYVSGPKVLGKFQVRTVINSLLDVATNTPAPASAVALGVIVAKGAPGGTTCMVQVAGSVSKTLLGLSSLSPGAVYFLDGAGKANLVPVAPAALPAPATPGNVNRAWAQPIGQSTSADDLLLNVSLNLFSSDSPLHSLVGDNSWLDSHTLVLPQKARASNCLVLN